MRGGVRERVGKDQEHDFTGSNVKSYNGIVYSVSAYYVITSVVRHNAFDPIVSFTMFLNDPFATNNRAFWLSSFLPRTAQRES